MIDKWFLKDACSRHDAFSCRVTTAHQGDDPTPIGFYSMSLILESDKLIKGVSRINNRGQGGFYPAVHIEYLAVVEALHGQGLGTDMMQRALLSFRNAAIDLGVQVLTLVPITDKLVDYYKKLGFASYATHMGQKRMMLTAQQAIAAPNL